MTTDMTQQEVAPGKVLITLTGKIMMGAGGGQIVETVDELMKQGVRIVVFDMSGVTALDSTGVGYFIVSFNKLAAAGGEMRMAGATGHVFQTFHVSLLDQIFPFFENAGAAVAA